MSDINLRDALEQPWKLPLGTAVSCLVGFVYVSGYLIHSFFTRGKGIPSLSLVNAEYIHTGIVFLCLSMFIIALPVVICRAMVKSHHRTQTRIPKTDLITPFVATIYLYCIVFYALFITQADWEGAWRLRGTPLSVKSVSLTYFFTIGVLLCTLPALRGFKRVHGSQVTQWFSADIDNARTSRKVRALVVGIQLLEATVTILFLSVLWQMLPWLPAFMNRMVLYVLSLVVVCVAAWVILSFADIFQWKGSDNIFLVIGLPFLLAFYLVIISSYSYAVYNNLPANRGGRYPLTTATLTLEPNYFLAVELVATNDEHQVVTKPLYICEDSDNFLYVVRETSSTSWFVDTPRVFAIKKDSILQMRYDYLTNGGPRRQ